MMSAEQDAVVQIGFAVVAYPERNVVRFTPGRWPIAVGKPASAIPRCQRHPLFRRVQPLLSPDVQWTPIRINADHDRSAGAHQSLDDSDIDRVGLPLHETVPVPGPGPRPRPRPGLGPGLGPGPGSTVQRVDRDQYSHDRSSRTEKLGRVGGGTMAKQFVKPRV